MAINKVYTFTQDNIEEIFYYNNSFPNSYRLIALNTYQGINANFDSAHIKFEYSHNIDSLDDIANWFPVKFNGVGVLFNETGNSFEEENRVARHNLKFRFTLQNPTANTKIFLRLIID